MQRRYDVLYLCESLKGVTTIAAPLMGAWRCTAASIRTDVAQRFTW